MPLTSTTRSFCVRSWGRADAGRLHAQIEREAGHFTFAEVCDGVCRKLLDRHPHIFRGDES